MASQGGTSRLAQMQMRFQQKQQQEKELKKIELTGTRSVGDSETKSLNSSIGAGKVRQMFDERRHRSTGIDKSYPLKPIPGRVTGTASTTTITTSSRTTTSRKQSTTVVKQTSTGTSSSETALVTKKTNGFNGNPTLSSKKLASTKDTVDYSVMNNNDLELAPTTVKSDSNISSMEKLSLDDNKNLNGYSTEDRNNNKSSAAPALKLKPVVTKKSAPETKTIKRPDSKTSSPSSSRLMSPAPEKASPTRMASKTNSKKQTAPASTPPENVVACRTCSRHFNVDRIEKHELICERTASKKRKVFDAAKHRVMGTEAEQFVKRAIKSTQPKMGPAKGKETPKGNWRKKHEEFIATIRAAKEMQAHLARGGKLSDLPPPPPSENPDYVQCPHCKRKFNEAAAARHIPKCAEMRHNKPKPGAQIKKAPGKK